MDKKLTAFMSLYLFVILCKKYRGLCCIVQ